MREVNSETQKPASPEGASGAIASDGGCLRGMEDGVKGKWDYPAAIDPRRMTTASAPHATLQSD